MRDDLSSDGSEGCDKIQMRGRKQAAIDWVRVAGLAGCGMDNGRIADVLHVSRRTLIRRAKQADVLRVLAEIREHRAAIGKLNENIYRLAMSERPGKAKTYAAQAAWKVHRCV